MLATIGFIAAVAARKLPARIWGVTIDNVTKVTPIVDSLRRLRTRPMARIVFDPGVSPAYYSAPVTAISAVANIMGSPVDSAPPSARLSVDAYRQRMAAFMDGLGPQVDLWEIGNEVNGDWTGDSAEMGAKVAAAFAEARARRLPTAVTLTYSDSYLGREREMAAWSRRYLSEAVRHGVDYVLVSFYTDTATGPQPDWKHIFGDLAECFPHAKLGFGELGLRNADFTLSNDTAGKAALIRRYYGMRSPLEGARRHRFVGGFFWWTYCEDACEPGARLWKTFHDVMR